MKEKELPDFEESLRKLEALVEKLESPKITLDESLKLYEEGMELSKHCSNILDEAVIRIEEINSSSESKSGSQ